MDGIEWMKDGACIGLPPEVADRWFFGTVAESRIGEALCAQCPVIDRCAEWGKRYEYGVWAGVRHKPKRHGGPNVDG